MENINHPRYKIKKNHLARRTTSIAMPNKTMMTPRSTMVANISITKVLRLYLYDVQSDGAEGLLRVR